MGQISWRLFPNALQMRFSFFYATSELHVPIVFFCSFARSKHSLRFSVCVFTSFIWIYYMILASMALCDREDEVPPDPSPPLDLSTGKHLLNLAMKHVVLLPLASLSPIQLALLPDLYSSRQERGEIILVHREQDSKEDYSYLFVERSHGYCSYLFDSQLLKTLRHCMCLRQSRVK